MTWTLAHGSRTDAPAHLSLPKLDSEAYEKPHPSHTDRPGLHGQRKPGTGAAAGRPLQPSQAAGAATRSWPARTSDAVGQSTETATGCSRRKGEIGSTG